MVHCVSVGCLEFGDKQNRVKTWFRPSIFSSIGEFLFSSADKSLIFLAHSRTFACRASTAPCHSAHSASRCSAHRGKAGGSHRHGYRSESGGERRPHSHPEVSISERAGGGGGGGGERLAGRAAVKEEVTPSGGRQHDDLHDTRGTKWASCHEFESWLMRF